MGAADIHHDIHQVMQTVIDGYKEENLLGYDSVLKTFVVHNRSTPQVAAGITTSVAEVSARLTDYLNSHDVQPVDLQQLLAILKLQGAAKKASASIAAIAEQKLRLHKEISQVLERYKDRIIAPPVDTKKLQAELQQSRGIKIVLANYPQTQSHTVYWFDPEQGILSTAATKGLGPDAVKVVEDYITRTWTADKVLRAEPAANYPRLTLLRFQSNKPLTMRDCKNYPANSVFIQPSPNVLRFRSFHLFKKKAQDTGFVFCLFSHSLADLAPTLKVMDLIMQVFEKHEARFVSSRQRGSLKPEDFLTASRPDQGKLLLEFVNEKATLRAHYLDVGDGCVKYHDFPLSEKETLASVNKALSEFSEKLKRDPDICRHQVWEKYGTQILSESFQVAFCQEEILAGQSKICLTDSGHEIYYLHPHLGTIETHYGKGMGPNAIQESLDLLRRMGQVKQAVDSYTAGSSVSDVKIRPSSDYRHFIVSFSDSHYSEVTFQILSASLEDLANAVARAREQKQDLEQLKVSDFILKQLSPLSTIEIPPAPPGVEIKALIDLFERISWLDPESPFYRDSSKLRDDGKVSSVERFQQGIKTLVEKASEESLDELYTIMAHVVKLLQEEEDPQLFTRSLLDLAEGGLHCEGRNLGVAYMVYRTLKRKADAVHGKEVYLSLDLIHRWLDDLKIDTINSMVAAGNNPQNSHELLFYIQTLLKNDIVLPDSLLERYKDANIALGKFGKYQTEEAVKDGFISQFNSMKIVETSLEQTDQLLKTQAAKTGAALKDLLRAYVENALLAQHEQVKVKLEALQSSFQSEQKSLSKRQDIKAEKMSELMEEMAENYTEQRGRLLDQIIEDQGFINVDASLTNYSLTRAGARAILLYAKMLQKR